MRELRADGISISATNRQIYNKETFMRLRERDKSETAQKINQFRLSLVNKYANHGGYILDIGIGAGTFMDLHGHCLGFDINPYAVKLLKNRGLFFDPYHDDFGEARISAVTFFDSLEHIVDPSRILDRLTKQLVFVSTPIFYNVRHMMNSKHFKPVEHVWHFTRKYFGFYMEGCGFRIIEERADETLLGRTDIKTFVLRKKAGG